MGTCFHFLRLEGAITMPFLKSSGDGVQTPTAFRSSRVIPASASRDFPAETIAGRTSSGSRSLFGTRADETSVPSLRTSETATFVPPTSKPRIGNGFAMIWVSFRKKAKKNRKTDTIYIEKSDFAK